MVANINQDIVYGLAVSPDFEGNKICFAARQSGLWRSNNGGEEWQLINHIAGVPPEFPASALAISSNFQTDGTVFAGVPGAIVQSSDSGKTWTVVALASPPPFVSALAVSPNYKADGVIFAATLEDGLFRSQDRGVTWRAWNFGLFDLNILGIVISPAFADDRTVYIGAETGIFCSKNGGHAWKETNFPSNLAPVQSLALSPQFTRDGIVFAGTEAAGLLYSNDRGLTWESILECGAINAILLSSNFRDTAHVLVVSSDVLWLSQDSGKSWSKRNSNEAYDSEFTSAAGGAPGSALLVGLSDGQVLLL